MYLTSLTFLCKYGRSDEGGGQGDGKDGIGWRLPGLIYVDDLVLCGELEEGLKSVV